jgi:hypothetical protein
MAVVKKHWKFFVAQLIAITIIAISCVVWLQKSTIRAEVPGGSPPGTSNSAGALDPLVYSRVAELRSELALTNVDLAAMGCSGPVSRQVLTQLVTWTQQNAERWNQAEQAVLAADRALTEAHRKLNVGPRDESLLTQVATLKTARTTAADAKAALLVEAGSAVESLLAPAQRQIWQDARANKSLPEQFRFAANLTPQELASIKTNYARRGGDSAQGRQVVQQLLGGTRAATAAAVRANRAAVQSDVCTAEAEMIVPPAIFAPTTQPVER